MKQIAFKKAANMILIIAVCFSFVSTVSAKSGCCSSHGGVSCGAGAQSDGRVICNDGWTGSSCLYSEMVMCGGSTKETESLPPQVEPTQYIPPPTVVRLPTSIPTLVPTKKPLPTSVPPTTLPTSSPILTESTDNNKDDQIVVSQSTDEDIPPPTAGETATALGVLGGMGYGTFWAGKKLLARIVTLVS